MFPAHRRPGTACQQRHPPDHPQLHGRGKVGEGGHLRTHVITVCDRDVVGPLVERRVVLPKQVGGTGQPEHHTVAEVIDQRRQSVPAQTGAGVPVVAVVRVVLGRQAELDA